MTPDTQSPAAQHLPPMGGKEAGSLKSPRSEPATVPDLGFDLYRLDCAVEAIKGRGISPDDRAELVRVSNTLMDLLA